MARVRSVWWRRPRAFEISSSITDPGHAAFAYTESVEAMGGFWPALDMFWINEPRHEDAAARKPFQLHMAARAGLHIPRTVVTNNPEEAREFAESNPCGTIYKAFLATERDWRETRMLRQDELALLDRVRHAPVIFQEYIPADADLRVTIVGDRIFPAAIYTRDGAYQYDFRMDMDNARYEPCALPAEVEHGLHRLMDSLGLVYGAVDMRRGLDGRYVFLEVNPSGQWRFVEEKTGQPITEAMARALMNP
jgi:glutathione synthase/RimK-type ligase-like ATP-grasp enzyme